MNSYQQKLADARALIVQHNSQISDSRQIDVEKFFISLTNAGGTNDSALSQSSWEDLQDFGLPKLLARQVAQVFRVKEEKPALKKSKIEAMSVGELISNYSPKSLVNTVTERLKAIFGNKRFVVFNDSGEVDFLATTKLAQELLVGYPERELYVVDSIPSKTYQIGERPDQCFDENPLYPGRILRPDGDCDQTNRSWNGVSLEVKQIVYLAITKSGELRIASINEAHNILDLIVGKEDADAIKLVRSRFPKATAHLGELRKQNNSPSLKIYRKENVKKNDPFGKNMTY